MQSAPSILTPYGYTQEPPSNRLLRKNTVRAVLPGVFSLAGLLVSASVALDVSVLVQFLAALLILIGVAFAVVVLAVFSLRSSHLAGWQVALFGVSLLITAPAAGVAIVILRFGLDRI